MPNGLTVSDMIYPQEISSYSPTRNNLNFKKVNALQCSNPILYPNNARHKVIFPPIIVVPNCRKSSCPYLILILIKSSKPTSHVAEPFHCMYHEKKLLVILGIPKIMV